jgi:hypothetical protein
MWLWVRVDKVESLTHRGRKIGWAEGIVWFEFATFWHGILIQCGHVYVQDEMEVRKCMAYFAADLLPVTDRRGRAFGMGE